MSAAAENGAYAASRQRVEAFLEAWAEMRDKTDIIYGLGIRREDITRDLLASDLRVLIDSHRHYGHIGVMCHSHDGLPTHWHKGSGWSYTIESQKPEENPAPGEGGVADAAH